MGYAEKVSDGSDGPSFDLGTITVEAKRPDWESKLSPGTVTVIRPDDYEGEQKDLSELLKMVPGVHVRELNGKGQYTTVSVRGSTAAQVGVFVDGVLYNLGGDAAVDISTIPVKNVERIEVYRGYIPARFGGTYIGGVINIVTKRPSKPNVSASFGKSSYGGYKGSLQIDAPLGKGSFMLGVNRDQSQGDFRYQNYNNDEAVVSYQKVIDVEQGYIDSAYASAITTTFSALKVTEINGHTAEYYASNLAEWNTYLASNAAYSAAYDTVIAATSSTLSVNKIGSRLYSLSDYNISSNPKYTYVKESLSVAELAMVTPVLAYASASERAAYIQSMINNGTYTYADYWNLYVKLTSLQKLSYTYGVPLSNAKRLAAIEKYKSLQEKYGDGTRYRKYNDYKNTDVIAKWQDDHWLAKATWKEIDRHLPRSLMWQNSPSAVVDTDIPSFANARTKQTIISKEALVGRRDTIGNLEWGWNINYLNQAKRYKCENWKDLDKFYKWFYDTDNVQDMYSKIPMRKWSVYDSRRWGTSIDGTYKAGNNHMLEFMINYSDENMDVKGSGITDGTLETGYSSTNRYRTDYTQKLFNVQLQDTITLNKRGDLWLTPSIRYNQSEINSGKAVGWATNVGTPPEWMFDSIDQQDNKVTWQLALKKQINENLTLRTTCGTYYRLLNLYEIAGDGGSILPAPISSNSAVKSLNFPVPEEGKQFDISAIWNGRALGADSKVQLTYFYRNADKLLMLWRYGYDYWSYTNTSNGKAKGVEIQTDMSWKKWDLNLGATYLKASAARWNDSPAVGQTSADSYSVHQTYTPEWEGFCRLGYRPDKKTMLFGEIKYVDEMYTSYDKNIPSVQDSLTTVGLGIKHQFGKDFQAVVGCSDIFNKGPQLKVHEGNMTYNADYPLQGRTYYTTLQYKF
nr:TonB-dependent receptor [Sporomusa acidovorans]